MSTKDTELHDFLSSIPGKLDKNMEALNAHSASAVIVQGGQVLQKVCERACYFLHVH